MQKLVEQMSVIEFMKSRWKLLVGHFVLAALLSIFIHPIAGLSYFAGWESGQARGEIPGSMYSPEKWLAIAKYIIHPIILVQWLLQGVIALLISYQLVWYIFK